MKVIEAKKMMKFMLLVCPKCGSDDTKTLSHMTPNMGGDTWENRICLKCGHKWERTIKEYSRRM